MKKLLKKSKLIYFLGKKIRYYYRRLIGSYKLKADIKRQESLRIVVGADGIFDEDWIATSVEVLNLLIPDDWNKFFKPDSIEAILAEHVWEHLTEEEGVYAARTCFKYLKSGGYLRVAVPDGYHPDPSYLENVKVGGIGSYAWDHKILYNYKSLKQVFELAEFSVILYEHFDERGVFHQKEWAPGDGIIHRSRNFDRRNEKGQLNYTSIILDAFKDA